MITIPAVQSTRVRHGVLIKLTVNGTDYFISNSYGPITYNGDTYQALGHFLGLDSIQDDIRTTNNQISISLSGIPVDATEAGLPGYTSYIAFILDQKIKGSQVQVYRAFYDPDNLSLLTDSVSLRFSGYISNYNITDGVDLEGKVNNRTVVIQCSSVNGILERRIAGRRTNRADQRSLYPTDISMDFVAAISNTSFNFGRPYINQGTGGGSGSGGYSGGSFDISQAG